MAERVMPALRWNIGNMPAVCGHEEHLVLGEACQDLCLYQGHGNETRCEASVISVFFDLRT